MRRSSPTPILLAVLCVACSGERDNRREEARAKWVAEHPATYVIEACVDGLTRDCTQAAVADGRVIRARHTYPEPQELDVSELPEPVEARFDELDAIHADPSCRTVTESFDSSYGYPTVYGAFCGTESFETRVTCFLADTNDLDACPPLTSDRFAD